MTKNTNRNVNRNSNTATKSDANPAPVGGNAEASAATPDSAIVHRSTEGADNGDAARGTANSRANQNETTHPTGDNVVPLLARTKGNGIFGTLKGIRAGAAAKIEGTQDIRQKLAEAFDMYGKGGEAVREADELVGKASLTIIRLLTGDPAKDVAPSMSNEELNALLGDQFGYKTKGGKSDKPVKAGDPDASKTPFGQGEAIRKRIVRMQQAIHHCNGGDGGRAFADADGNPLPLDARSSDRDGTVTAYTVPEIVEAVMTGELSVFSAYDKLAKVKADNASRTDAAFNPKTVRRMVESLSTEGAVAMFAADPDLQTAYDELAEMLKLIAEAVSTGDDTIAA